MQAREAEKKLAQLKQFTRDTAFENVQKTYDESIAEQREKMLQGLKKQGEDPLAQLVGRSMQQFECQFIRRLPTANDAQVPLSKANSNTARPQPLPM